MTSFELRACFIHAGEIHKKIIMFRNKSPFPDEKDRNSIPTLYRIQELFILISNQYNIISGEGKKLFEKALSFSTTP